MCINQCETLVTIAFCQANRNRNVIPVRVDTDQSSSSVSHWRASSVSLLAETHFDDLKGRLCFFHYSNISGLDISVRPQHPLMSAVALPAYVENQHPECIETFMLGYFYFKEFSFYYYISDATLCKFIWLNYSLIEVKSQSIDQHGLQLTTLYIYGTVSYVFVCFVF